MKDHTQCGETPTYGKSLEASRDLSADPFVILSNQPAEATRRDFLSLMGFTLAAASLTGCSRGLAQKAIPLAASSDRLIPGVPNWYATTCAGCSAGCSLLVKTCDGRPVKIEGNADSPLFGGGTCAVGQATVLSLYDDERLRGPLWQGSDTTWEEIDRRVMDGLSAARAKRQKIVLLSGTLVSPSMRNIVGQWARHPDFRHIVYDPISMSALRNAHLKSFGRALVPHYRFDHARLIIGLEADFLGTWLSPVDFARQYAITRNPENASYLSHHIQFESGLSITGANADLRIPVVPSMLGSVAVALLRRVAARIGMRDFPPGPDPLPHEMALDAVGDKLWKHRGESLVVSGVQDVSVQVVIAALNAFLGNIGKTINLSRPSLQRMGDDREMEQLVGDMNRGEIGALILCGVNPAYDYAEADRFLEGLEKVPLSVSFSDRRDETSSHVHAICPDHHFLEAWGDAEPVDSCFSLAQPTISPMFETRAAQENLLRWLGQSGNYYTYLREFWRNNMFLRQSAIQNFDDYWDQTLRTGVTELPSQMSGHSTEFHGPWREAAQTIIESSAPLTPSSNEINDRYELHLYESVGLRDGRHANNPWLQELPDPITRLTWGNAAAISPGLAKKLDLQSGDIVVLKTEHAKLEIPVFIQPGQEARTLSIPLGYGRKQVGTAGTKVGVNAYPLARIVDGVRRYSAKNVAIEKTGKHEALAATQSHFSIEGRPIVREMTVAQLVPTAAAAETQGEAASSLWPARPEGDHSWGMVIDLNSCTGCSACVIACQAENNVPVVGKREVIRNREMHWIRIDRYYSGSEENLRSVQQPMMCQHCGRAPCETVCPVLATTHSSDGLNQQVYNRCVGTRYCLNNCPYKVRRFNWHEYSQNPEYDYTMESPMGRMVLNPEVTVRSRGVMEKCSMCVQRIQSAKTAALQAQRSVRDGDIQTACQQACPTQAIVFGDLKDLNSRASRLRRNQRYYHVLEGLGTLPNVGYLAKVRNPLTT
ncbi:MAG TPA: 4Fe-4S dicluster domain-containing protein [Terriglobales bacterium]|nr:4Fe-4S dicluster domain-containing protein [Terriglobales bacterium]